MTRIFSFAIFTALSFSILSILYVDVRPNRSNLQWLKGVDVTKQTPDISPQAAVPFPSSNGNLDATFGSGGVRTNGVGFGNDVAQSVAVQSDGKIVAAGYAYNGFNNDFAVARYHPDGSLDDTFDGAANGNGIVMTPIGNSEDEAFGIALQTDGKILLVGQTSNGVNTDIGVIRYNPNGTLDNTFDNDGLATFGVANGNDLGRSVAVQSDGKIVIAGNALVGTTFDIVVVRLEATGLLDASFDGNAGNGNGIVTTAPGAGNDQGYTVAIQPDGRIVVAGYYTSAASTDTVILRYNPNGSLDTTFNGDGVAVHDFSPGNTDEALAMASRRTGRS